MKKNRKLTALLVAACMTIPMAATTFTVPMMASAEGTGKITINADTTHNSSFENADYYAIQVFKGSVSGTGASAVFGVSGWGDSINVDTLLTELSTDNSLKKYFGDTPISNDVNSAANVVEKAAKLDEIQDNAEKNAAKAAFSRAIARNIKLDTTKSKEEAYNAASGGKKATANKDGQAVISDLDTGYYIILECYAPTYTDDFDGNGNIDNGNDEHVKTSRTLGILKVVDGDVTGINPKRSYPTVTKTVKEGDDGDYSSATDAQVGETVDFKITCTLPDHLEYYEHYYLEINDILGKGFELQGDITVSGNAVKDKDYFIEYTNKDNKDENTGISIKFEDINRSYASSGTIDITYQAKLTASGTGNNAFTATNPDPQENYVSVTYLSNPNATYTTVINSNDNALQKPDVNDSVNEPNMSTSQGSIAKVYTYELDIHKYASGDDNKALLPGATFVLKNSDQSEYLKIDGGIISWGSFSDATTFTSVDNEVIKIKGLDKGTYYLEETVAPGGYNKLTSDQKVEIIPTINNAVLNTLAGKLNDIDINGNANTGVVEIEIANTAGATLPSTGGIGTKIFYVLGGTLVIGSGAALVIKKRMGKDEE